MENKELDLSKPFNESMLDIKNRKSILSNSNPWSKDNKNLSKNPFIEYIEKVSTSPSWNSLENMLNWLKYKGETIDAVYLRRGIENTINNGYELARIDKGSKMETRVDPLPESKL